ncbi:MAG: hypothetical protein IJS58_02410 [Bacilli bacterium]|nr:hypothetical protein [Bacilli bacterium]
MSRKSRENIIGKIFDQLTVIAEAEDYIEPKSGNHRPQWLCRCSCGNTILATSTNLRALGKTKQHMSCGCLKDKFIGESNRKYNTFDILGKYGKGWTGSGDEFWFDLEDYDLIKDYYWQKFNNGYFVTSFKENGKIHTIQLHRLILGIENENPYKIVGDHIHGSDTLYDNRKSNLRIATRSQNVINRKSEKYDLGEVVGVYWHKSHEVWVATINDKPNHRLTRDFQDYDSAVKWRKEMEQKYYGEFVYQYNNREVTVC